MLEDPTALSPALRDEVDAHLRALTGEGVCVFDGHGRLTYANARARDLIGWNDAREDRPNIRCLLGDLRHSLTELSPGARICAYGAPLICSDGRPRSVGIIATPASGHVVVSVVCAVDDE